MTLLFVAVAMIVILGVGIVVARRTGWRIALGAVLLTLLVMGGVYVGLVMLIVNSME